MASNKRASFLIKDQTPAELINGALDFIVQVSSQKKHTKLQSECKSLMEHFNTNLPTVSLSPSNEIPTRLPPASVEHSVQTTDLAASREPPHSEAATESSVAAGEGGQASVAEETASVSEPEPTLQDAPNNGTVETPAVSQGGASEVPANLTSTSGHLSQESAGPSGNTAITPPSPAKKVRVNEGLHLTEDNLTKLLTVLRQAQDTRLPKVMEMIQDVLQRLIAHGLIKGSADALKASTSEEADKDASGIEGSGVPTAAAGVIDLMCRGVEGGEEAELQVLKGLLTAVSSSTLQVHGESLLRVVRTCYNIYLASKSEINQTTAKACLTQMLTVVFHRMEADSEVVPMTPIVVAHLIQPTGSDDLSNPMLQFVQTFVNKALIDLEAALYPPVPSEWRADQSDEVDAPEDVVFDKDDMDAKSWEVSVYRKSMEEERKSTEDNDTSSQVSQATSDPEFSQQSGILRRDAFLVFRALCKLSMKAPSEGLSDPFQARGKALSLELVKILLENSGRVFRSSPKFIGAIKQYLCMSLLKNCSSPSPQAFQLSCSIFGTLLQRFRDAMKAEIGVFFPMILLRVLEAHSSSFQSKSTVLRCLQQHCLDSQLLVDLFVNYDCDLEAGNLFERTVNTLVKVAQRNSGSSDAPLTPVQDSALRLDSMQSLVCILRSLATWIDRQPEHSLDAVSTDAELSQEVARERTETCVAKEGSAAPGAPAAPSTEGDLSETTPSEAQHFVSKKAEKLELQQGVDLFKKKPAKGIKLLQKLGRLGDDPEEIANFLKTTSSLDRTAIGDFLGEREDLSLKVMHAYVDGMAFSGQTFDEAIRSFLSGFRLPGEAQKIDRLMEKFAERFCKCNPNEFKSADTAYVLAYSVVMLNTDAHNPMVIKKMNKAEFLKNNRGIDDGKDLAPEYLGALYDRITTNEIRMKDEKDAGPTPGTNKATNRLGLDLLLNLFPGRRTAEGSEVSEEAIRNTQAKLREGSRSGQRFHVATHGENVRPMLQVAWPPMLAAFSLPMEESDDPHTVALCLDGFRYAIHIASVLNMETLRDAFVTSLTKFTLLVSPANMQPKNVEAIKTLALVAEEEGNHLQDAWMHVLKNVSRFDLVYHLYSGVMTDASFFAAGDDRTPNKGERRHSWRHRVNDSLKKLQPHPKKGKDGKLARPSSEGTPVASSPLPLKEDTSASLASPSRSGQAPDQPTGSDDAVAAAASSNIAGVGLEEAPPPPGVLEQIDPMEINRMFVQSERLNSEAIVEFVRALCAVSLEELRSPSPRVFALTKIVEIAHFNMSRIRLVWTRIWAVLSDYFITVGCHPNLQIAMYAVDSLRQLAMKFLERDELANYTFQNDFLKPFVVVMRQSSSVEIRELIIRCVSQMVLARVANVKSGWKSMFMVFTTAATDEQRSIVALAFETIEKIVREYFSHITETETATFTDCVNCLIAFTNSHFNMDISLNAIAFLRFCALKLAEGAIGNLELPAHTQSAPDADVQVYFWFPLLAGLSELTFDSRGAIRKSALEVLFDILKIHGHLFNEAFWIRVFDSILFPIFDHVRADTPGGLSDEAGTTEQEEAQREGIDAWLFETCTHCLQLVVDLVVQFYPMVRQLLPRMLQLLTSFVRRPHDRLAAVGVSALSRFLADAGPFFDHDTWQLVLTSIQEVAADTTPEVYALVSAPPERTDGETKENGGAPPMQGGPLDGWEPSRWIKLVQRVRCFTATQLLMVQALGELYHQHGSSLTRQQIGVVLDMLAHIQQHARQANADVGLRSLLEAAALAAGGVANGNRQGGRGSGWMVANGVVVPDPPLLRLETDSAHVYLSVLMNLHTQRPHATETEDAEEGSVEEGPSGIGEDVARVETRLVDACREVLTTFMEMSVVGESWGAGAGSKQASELSSRGSERMAAEDAGPSDQEVELRAPLVVSTLQALSSFGDVAFRRHLRVFFPLLTRLTCCEVAPIEVYRALSAVFSESIAPIVYDCLEA